MPLTSRWQVPIPQGGSLPGYLLDQSPGMIPDDKPMYLDADDPDNKYVTVKGLRLVVKQLALGLQKAGLKPGERVAVSATNHIYFPALFLGIIAAGGIYAGANPAETTAGLTHFLTESGASYAIVNPKSMGNFFPAVDAAAAKGAPIKRDRVYVFDGNLSNLSNPADAGSRHWTHLLAPVPEANVFQYYEPADIYQTPACLNFSSGTTGLPKGVAVSHGAYMANAEAVNYHNSLRPGHAESIEGARSLAMLPMYHVAGQAMYITNMPKQGVPTYIMSGYTFPRMLELVHSLRITHMLVVPPILNTLVKNPLTAKYDISSIEVLNCGAAPLSTEVADAVAKLTDGKLIIRQGWGMTELVCIGCLWSPETTKSNTTAGELFPNATVKLMDTETGLEITEAKVPGEVWFHAPTIMLGYWNRPDATAETIVTDPDGTRWIRTGDVAYAEEYKAGTHLVIVDRIKDLIKVKGLQVAPAELESILLGHEAVLDAGVVRVTEDDRDMPRAYVVKKPGMEKVTEKEIRDWVDGRVSSYKRLTGGVFFADAIPRNPTGKITRRLLIHDAPPSKPVAKL